MLHSRSADSVVCAPRLTLSQVSAATVVLSAPSAQLPAAVFIVSSTSSDTSSGSPSAPRPAGPAPLQLLSSVAHGSDSQHAVAGKSHSAEDAHSASAAAAAAAGSQLRTRRVDRSVAQLQAEQSTSCTLASMCRTTLPSVLLTM